VLATHKLNLDKGSWGITELEYSPINSDLMASSFGHLGLCIQSLRGTLIHGCIGVAHAAALEVFATAGGKRKAAKAPAARIEARANGTTRAGAVNEAAVQAKLSVGDTTMLFKLPREGRWALIKDSQRRYKIAVVVANRANAEAEARGRGDRPKAKAAAQWRSS
jgi:hypothetical protein